MLNTIRKRNQREKEKQKKLNSSAINLVIENNEQHLSITTPETSSSIIPTNFLSPSSNISNFNLLHLTNSGHNDHILQPNSSSMEVSEIISSVDIDRDNFIADHISSSSNVISGNF